MNSEISGADTHTALLNFLTDLADSQFANMVSQESPQQEQQPSEESFLRSSYKKELELLINTLSFEENNQTNSLTTSISDLIGRRRTNFYRDILSQRIDLLLPFIDRARILPDTTIHINYTQLSTDHHSGHEVTQSVPQSFDERLLVRDETGPAGLYLHKVFRSCLQVIEILLDENDTVIPGSDHTETSRNPVLAILAYRSQLVKNTYCTDPTQLRKALPGAVCLGLIREINDISHRSSDGEKQYLAQADALTTALSDLVDCCDLLVLNDYSTALNFAKNYINCGQTLRAQAILQKLLLKNSEDADVLQLLGQILEFDLDLDGAIEFYQKAVSLRPDDWVLHKDLGIAMLGKLEFDGGISSLQRALDQAPDNPDLLNEIKRAETLRKWLQDAALDDVMPTIAPCDEELAEGQFREESLALAEHLYHKHGTLHISNVFDIAMINDCKTQFVDEYKNYLGDQKQDDALQIGHRRFQVSIALHGSFNQPDFYANPFVLGIIKRLVGQDAIIGSTVCATSLPGSKDQHLHKDHRALFTVDEYDKPITIPPVSITTMIPLVSLTKENGTTLVKKGSHRLGTTASDKLADQVPLVPAGSCFLMDLALSHQGMGNQTDQVRPIINMVYHRRWFADNKNFKKQPPLQIKSAEFAKIPKQHRQLFDWCIQPGPQVNF